MHDIPCDCPQTQREQRWNFLHRVNPSASKPVKYPNQLECFTTESTEIFGLQLTDSSLAYKF